MNARFFSLIVLAAVLLAPPLAHAADIRVLVNFVMADGGTNDALGSERIYGFVIDNDTAYVQLTGGSLPQITRIESIGGGQEVTRLVTPAGWLAAAGNTTMLTFNGFDIVGEYLQFADTTSDEIWRVQRTTGEVIKYADQASIMAAGGFTNAVSLNNAHTKNPFTSEHVFYESTSRHILTTDGSNNVAVFISNEEMSNTFGNAMVLEGMAFDSAGNFYWSQYVSGSYLGIHKRDTNGTMSVFLTKAQLDAVHGADLPVPGAMLFAPDGYLYIRVRKGTAGAILRCDPLASNYVDTLSLYLSVQQLSNSVAQSANAGELGWYKGGLTWHYFEVRSGGIFVNVPTNEPALVITGAVEVTEYSSNVPYYCTLLMTNRWGTFFRYEHTSTAAWSIVGTAPTGVSLDGNLLTVDALMSNEYITLQAVTTAGALGVTNTYDVLLVPEPAGLAVLLALCALARLTRSDRSARSVRSL